LHLESSKQNYYIISLRAIINAIFTSLTDHGEATMDLEILTRRSLDVTIKCHEPRTYADSEENIFNKRLHEKHTRAAGGSRQPAGSVEASAVVFPQVRFLTPSAVSADPVDPPFMKVLKSLKMCTLCDRASPFVALAHRLHTRRAHATATRPHSLLYNIADLGARYKNNVQTNNPNSPCCAVLCSAMLCCPMM